MLKILSTNKNCYIPIKDEREKIKSNRQNFNEVIDKFTKEALET